MNAKRISKKPYTQTLSFNAPNDCMSMTNRLYTQRDWDRTVGWGKVPYKYSYTAKVYEDKRASKIMENNMLYSEHYGIEEYDNRYAHVYRDTTQWRVDMYDKNDPATYKIRYYENETYADNAAENWCLGYAE